MKKLKLKALELGAMEILSREQLKRVMGGGNCAVTFTLPNGGTSGTAQFDHCDYFVLHKNSNGTQTYTCYGTSMNTASGAAENIGSGAHWCCDSCNNASWYNPPTGSGGGSGL